MKTIDLTNAPSTVPELLKLAEEENVIIRTPDGKEFVIADIDDFDREIVLTRQNEELMRLLDERAKEKAIYTLEQVKERLGLD